jgi:hypothetical protein
MTSKFSKFTARLRERFLSGDQVARSPDFEICNPQFAIHAESRDSCNASLRDDDAFSGLALDLFALQYAHNPPYRRLCEARGVAPGKVTHWTQIPAVPAAAFKELELSCLPPNERTSVFCSSGTTGQRPSRHFHNQLSLAIYEASLWPWFRRHLLANGETLVILAPPPALAPHSSLVHMFETIRCRSRNSESADSALSQTRPSPFFGLVAADGAWTLDFETVLGTLREAIEHKRPIILLGTAFSFVHLLDFLADKSLCFELPPGSRVMETGGYKGRSRSLPKAGLHSAITERLGIPPTRIVCEYGMCELSSQAYDRVAIDWWRVTQETPASPHASPVTRHFHFPPWARAQIISPETGREVADGKTGLIRVFDLANVFSVMAIQTEDLGIRRGSGFELTGRAAMADPRGCSLLSIDSKIKNQKSKTP